MGLGYEDIYEDKHEKYQRQYLNGEIRQWDVEPRARASADRAHEAGNYVREVPAQQPGANPFPRRSSSSVSEGGGGVTLDKNGEYQYEDDPVLEEMFANVGGLHNAMRNDDDGASAGAPDQPGPAAKLGWGSRLWNGVKAVGGILKNLSGYNLIRHGIGGAFRKAKIRKNQAKLEAAQEGLDELKLAGQAVDESGTPVNRRDPVRGRQLQKQFDEAEGKLHFNRLKLGEHRKYRTGREWKNEWSRLFTGRDAKLSAARNRYQHGYDYTRPDDAPSSGTASASVSSDSSEAAPVDAPGNVPVAPIEQQVQQSEPQPLPQQQPAGHETLAELNELMRFDGDVDDHGNVFGDNEDDEAQKEASIKSLTQSALGQAGQLPADQDDDQDDYQSVDYGDAMNNHMFGNDDNDDD